jgi:hypothetical protein
MPTIEWPSSPLSAHHTDELTGSALLTMYIGKMPLKTVSTLFLTRGKMVATHFLQNLRLHPIQRIKNN